MQAKTNYPEAQNPIILRSHRLMEAFAKSDDERDFYLDKVEGFIIYVNLDKTEEELLKLEKELDSNPERYCLVPKLSFFETKKIMEGFVNEKVYDIDTKEKLLDIIQSKEAREHFLEFIYDQHSELEKWQQYYQERSRIRIIEWLRGHHFTFVFEEDLDLSTSVVEKLKENLFEKKVQRDVEVARKSLVSKSKTYYSNEALNPRPKRGRPPKQTQKLEMEPQISTDIYTTVPPSCRPFLFTPEISSALDVTFSSKFETGEELVAHRRQPPEPEELDERLSTISQKLATLKQLSSRWRDKEQTDFVPKKVEDQIVEEEDVLKELGDEERKLFKRLEERKKKAKSQSIAYPESQEKRIKKLDVKEKSTSSAKPKRKKEPKVLMAKKPVKKRIMPVQDKKPKSKPAAKAKKSVKSASVAKKTEEKKRPIRKILPKSAEKKKRIPKRSLRKTRKKEP